jgi:di/tricarboxylate transporter
MTIEILIIFLIIAGAIALFTLEKMPVDLTALVVMASLLLTGLVSPQEGISGFSNSATVTVAAMFILSSALFKSGALNFFSYLLRNVLKKSYWSGLFLMMLFSGVVSGFINNTAVVALLMPLVISVCRSMKLSPSKLLIPLSFSVILGGVCTLIGTSTNILASSLVQQYGEPPIGMFEMTPFGIILFAIGLIYILTIGARILPDRGIPSELTDDFEMAHYITEIVMLPNSKSIGTEIQNSPIIKDVDLDILEIHRDTGEKLIPTPNTIIREYDVLKVRCNIEKLQELQLKQGIKLKSDKRFFDEDLYTKETRLVEAVITPYSRLIGRTLKGINFRSTFGATVLAIRHRGKVMHEKLGKTNLLPGDVLLIEVKKEWLPQLRQNASFIIISELLLSKIQKIKIVISVLVIAAIIISSALNLMPIVASAIIGSVILVLTGCITLEEAYRAIDWKVIFLLAGLVTLGIALEKSGGAGLIASALISISGSFGNSILISAFFLISMILTAFMSNNASVALLIPIAVLSANTLGIDSRPYIMAVTFAASVDFMTPIGYQTNTMVYGPGNYRFSDYLKIGTPLNIIFWLLGSLLIPLLF